MNFSYFLLDLVVLLHLNDIFLCYFAVYLYVLCACFILCKILTKKQVSAVPEQLTVNMC